MLVTFHAHGETGRYHSYRRGSNNLDQSISDSSLKRTQDVSQDRRERELVKLPAITDEPTGDPKTSLGDISRWSSN